MADKESDVADEITEEELADIFEEDMIAEEEPLDEIVSDEEPPIDDLGNLDLEDTETDDGIGEDEFLSELVEEGEDVVTENVNKLLNDYKFTKSSDSTQYRYLFDDILSKYWYQNVLEEEYKDEPDMNMYYRWLAVINFNTLTGNESWEKFLLDEKNGEKIIELYNAHDLPETNDILDELYNDEPADISSEELTDAELDGIFGTDNPVVADESAIDEDMVLEDVPNEEEAPSEEEAAEDSQE